MKKQPHDIWEEEFRELKERAARLIQTVPALDGLPGGERENLEEEYRIAHVELEMQCEELQQARLRLEQSQQYLADIFELTPVGYLIMGDDGVIRNCNQAAADLFELKKEVLRHQRLQAFVPHSDLETFSRCFQQTREDQATHTAQVSFRTRQQRHLIARVTFFYLKSHFDGEHVLVCAVEDVSAYLDKQRLEQERNLELEKLVAHRTRELEQLNRQLTEEINQRTLAQQQADLANRAKAHFLAAMSHDIRTPLSGIIMAFQLLREAEKDDTMHEVIELGSRSGELLMDLINQILDYSRLEAGALDIEQEPFTLREHLAFVVNSFRERVRAKGLRLRQQIASDVPEIVVGDALRVKQILMNLLSNAVKFTAAGTVEVQVRCLPDTVAADKVRLELQVSDTGIGIRPEVRPKLFEPFAQGDGSIARRFGGTGLGLAIVRELLRRMEGDIQLESAPDAGTKAICRLTLALPPVDAKERAGAGGQQRQELAHGLRVLLVEDNETNRRLLQTLLQPWHWDLTVAETGEEALDLIRFISFDLILLDIGLPGISGDRVAAAVRRSDVPATRRTPLIALTAYALKGDREKYLGLGFDGYVSKPILLEALIAEIDRILGRNEPEAPPFGAPPACPSPPGR